MFFLGHYSLGNRKATRQLSNLSSNRKRDLMSEDIMCVPPYIPVWKERMENPFDWLTRA